MIPTSFENEHELQRVLAELIVAVEALQLPLHRMIGLLAEHSSLDLQCVVVDSGGSVPVDRPPSPTGIRLVGSAANYRKPAVPPWRGSAQYQFVKRAGVWIETYREDPFATHSLIAARATEAPPDPGRVQWDG